MTESFRDLLSETLALRIKRNPSYSLRALARDLNLAPSTISEILSGKYGTSPSTIRKVAKKLNLSRSVISGLLDDEEDTDANSHDPTYYEFDASTFSLVGKWYYLAILALADRPLYADESAKIAEALGIDISEAERAIVLLCDLDLLRQEKDGRLTNEFRSTFVPDGVAPKRMIEFHAQILDMAKAALVQVPRERRFFETRFVNLSVEGYLEAQEILIEAGKKLEQISNKYENQATVYNMAWQLFPAHGDLERTQRAERDSSSRH